MRGTKWGKYLKVKIIRVKTYKSSNQVRCSEDKKEKYLKYDFEIKLTRTSN